MKLSLNWLSDWTSIDRDVPALCELLTMAGLEVDGYESVAEGLDGVVIEYVRTANNTRTRINFPFARFLTVNRHKP